MEMNTIATEIDHNGNSVILNAKLPKHQLEPHNNTSFCIENIICYQLKSFLFVICSNSCNSKHRVLKLDRRCLGDTLLVDNEQRVYSTTELRDYRKREGFSVHSRNIESAVVAYGIIGMVRFLEGYYLILITKRRCVAMVGQHCIYSIEDTEMLYIPNQRQSNSEEQRYLNTFNNVDLRSNFYFSYSYDLSNTLQCNLASFQSDASEYFKFYGHGTRKTIWDVSADFLASYEPKSHSDSVIEINPRMKFVWNEHLLSPLANLHSDFFLYICHGFVDQAFLPFSGQKVMITLIARRSKQYAGTRYLKRGVNCEGFPANEVETEQIVHDADIASFQFGRFSSFVQTRGSIPTYWSQNITHKITKLKPSINIDLKDPFFEAAGKHFNNLLYDYGSPTIVLNLVKRKEKKPQESILYNEFEEAIEYLNQFLPKQHQIMLIGFDMARMNKMKDQNVITLLSEIALFTLKKTGFFLNRPAAINKGSDWSKAFPNCGNSESNNYGPMVQTGIIRVNCVDCLDRTNTAQFAIGRIALAHQLFAIGAIAKAELPIDTDIVRQLEVLYEDHGDTLALQYGGSQLVHRIKSYRKIEPLTAQSMDKVQSLSRYFSNTFSDTDKQHAMNLFLGIYAQSSSTELIWSMKSDYTLHHNLAHKSKPKNSTFFRTRYVSRTRYTKWLQDEVAKCLPRAARQFNDCKSIFSKRFTNYDWFFVMYRLQSLTTFTDLVLNLMHEKLTDYSSITNMRKQSAATHKRSLLMKIGKLRGNEEDSDDSDLSDDSETSVIIRFERDCKAVSCTIRQAGNNECDDVLGGKENLRPNAALSWFDLKTRHFYQNWMELGNLHFLNSSRWQSICGAYESLNSHCEKQQQVYNDYLLYCEGTKECTSQQFYSQYFPF